MQRHRTFLKEQGTSTWSYGEKREGIKSEEKEEGEEEEEEEGIQIMPHRTAVTMASFTDCSVEFLSPFTSQLHELFCQAGGRVDWRGWSCLQQQCVSIFLDLMEFPVSHLGRREEGVYSGRVMKGIVQCHCGCLQLLEWEEEGMRRRRRGHDRQDEEEDEEDERGVPMMSSSR